MATIDYNKIIDDNMGLVKSIVRTFRPKSKLEYDEMLQCGRIGLWEATKKYKPELGRFSTIAYPRIIWEILAQIKKHKRYTQKHDRVVTGEILGKENKGDIIQAFWEIIPKTLTEEEREIILLLVKGNKKTEIYKALNMSQTKFNTVLSTAIRKIKRANKNEKNPVL